MIRKEYSKKLAGFTLVEMLVFIFIFSIVSLAFYRTMVTGMQVALDSKNRLGALALANERMEIARNLGYEDVGTIGGIPSGIIDPDEEVAANDLNYQVRTVIQFVDDEFDDLSPADAIADDYKIVKIKVSWDNFESGRKEVSIVSRFVPPGLEVASGDGVLSIHIINSAGVGIPQALVHIVNNSVSPAVNITQETDNSGNLILPGAEQSIQNYALTVLKTNYETISTVALGDVSYSPIDVHASVVTGLLNTKSIVIDLLSNLTINTVDQFGAPIPNLDFHLTGGRILGTDNSVIPMETVFALDADETSDSNGEKIIAEQSPGQFSLNSIESVSGYTLVDVSPITGFEASPLNYKFSLLPNTSKTVTIRLANNEENSLLVKVLADSNDTPINEAQVRLTNGVDYDVSLTTSFDGVAFFPESSPALVVGEYTLEVTAVGFQNYSSPVTIEGLVSQEVQLTAS